MQSIALHTHRQIFVIMWKNQGGTFYRVWADRGLLMLCFDNPQLRVRRFWQPSSPTVTKTGRPVPETTPTHSEATLHTTSTQQQCQWTVRLHARRTNFVWFENWRRWEIGFRVGRTIRKGGSIQGVVGARGRRKSRGHRFAQTQLDHNSVADCTRPWG